MSIIIVIAVFIRIFFGLASSGQDDVFLGSSESSHWEYEILTNGRVMAAEPEFDEEYRARYPYEPVQAVRMTRTMTETFPSAEIEFSLYPLKLTEVFLDDDLLYTTVQNGERNREGFLLLNEKDFEYTQQLNNPLRIFHVRLPLPENYSGKKLKFITYYSEDDANRNPIYPYLGTDVSKYSDILASSVMPVVAMILCTVCTVLLMMVFVLDIPNEKRDLRILLLIAYFILLFIRLLSTSYLNILSGINERSPLWILAEWYFLPLYFYLALLLTKWRKWLMLAAVALWTANTGVEMYFNSRNYSMLVADLMGKKVFLLTLLFAGAFLWEYLLRRKKIENKKRLFLYAGLTAVVAAVCMAYEGNRAWNGSTLDYLHGLLDLVSSGYFASLTCFIQNICSIMAVIILAIESFLRNEETRMMVSVLEERGKTTMEGYNRMLNAEEATNSVRHEMSHHMIALMGLIRNGENQRADDYIASVVKELEHLPVFRYSQNTLVNIIAGSYLDRAEKMGIEVKHSLLVPESLDILDEDLSVFLTNMFQNALEACQRIEPEEKRYIHVKMYLHENFLFIGCANSMAPKQEAPSDSAEKKRLHGYGMKTMSHIAEKYGSILKVAQTSAEFSVKTNLCLHVSEETFSA